MKNIKLFEMFAGYGGASFALKKAGIPFECVGYSEIDKYAIDCYNQNHSFEMRNLLDCSEQIPKNYGDCTKIDPNNLPDFDLLTGGFPCQSFSVAGKGLGEQDTRGTLFHDIIRIAEVKKPKYMLLENVKGLTNKRHKDTFNKIISELERIGYIVRWKVLNSKEHGIPQNRERVFFVCFRLDYQFDYEIFKFPEKEELKIFLKDILEDNVDEKYYLKEKQINQLLPHHEVSYCIDANYHKGTNIKGFIEKKRRQLIQLNNPTHSNNRVYSNEGISPTINTMGGGNRQPFIHIKNATKKGYLVAAIGDGINLEQPNSKTRRVRVQKGMSSTLQTNDQRAVITQEFRIRKLTPKECFRLMGFLNDEIKLDYLSNTQKYKLAGNGWDINLVSKIFDKMYLK